MKHRIAELTEELRVLTAAGPLSLDMIITKSMAAYALALARAVSKSNMLKRPKLTGTPGGRMHQAWVHLSGPIGSYRVDAQYAPAKGRVVVSVTSHDRNSRSYDAMTSESPAEAAKAWMRQNDAAFAIETPPQLG